MSFSPILVPTNRTFRVGFWTGFFAVFPVAATIAGIMFFVRSSPDIASYRSYFAPHIADTINSEGSVKVTFWGVSSMLLDDGETQVLIDGFVTRPPMHKVFFGKVESDTGLVKTIIAQHRLSGLSGVVTCHSHYDHALDAPYFSKFSDALLIGSASSLQIGRGAGLPEDKMLLYQANQPFWLGKFRITPLLSKHSPAQKTAQFLGFQSDEPRFITQPLKQPAKANAFEEGGSYDLYIEHGNNRLLVKASANFVPNALDTLPVDVLFLGIGLLHPNGKEFEQAYYQQTVMAVKPRLVIPVHWDNFFKPLRVPLTFNPFPDKVEGALDFLISQTAKDSIALQLLDAFQSVYLFEEH